MVTGWRRPRAAGTARTRRHADTQSVRGIQRSFTIHRPGPQPADQVSQRQQAIDGERALAIRDDHERTGGHDISPSGRQREQIPVLVMQMDPVLTPVLVVRDKLEVLAEQRMEPVPRPHTPVPIIRTGCR